MTTLLGGTARVESALHGPAHADAFRVKVGRFGDRFYHDPLPACALAPETDETWPSVSTIKKAAGGDWSWVSLERAAQYLAVRREELKGLNAAEIHARLNEVNKAGLQRASGRGTAIHNAIEAMAAGQTEFPEMTKEALPYLPVARAFLDDHKPVWLFSEVVAISRTHRYGGTLDAILNIDGKVYLVDWKTRKPGKHGAYDEEAWQLSAYAGADYLIIDDGHGNAMRAHVPKLDGALIVSLTPEGYRLYPALLPEAWEAFLTLRALWDAQRIKVLAKPVILKVHYPEPTLEAPQPQPQHGPAVPAEEPAPVLGSFDNQAKRLWLLDRAKALNEQGHGKSLRLAWAPEWAPPSQAHKWTDDTLEAIERTLNDVERQCEANFPSAGPEVDQSVAQAPAIDTFDGLPNKTPPPPLERPHSALVELANDLAAVHEVTPEGALATVKATLVGTTTIAEGEAVDQAHVDLVAERMNALTGKPADLVRTIGAAMKKCGQPLRLKELPTRRRYEIGLAVVAWAAVDNEAGMRAALGLGPEGDIGAALAWLTIEEAQRLNAQAAPAAKPKRQRKPKA